MTTFSLHHPQMHRLLCPSNCSLNFHGSVVDDLFGFDSDLFGQFASRRDDERPDIPSACPTVVSVAATFKIGIAKDALDNWHQKGQSFARARSRLSDHVGSVKTLIDGQTLNIRHGVDVHPVDDRVNDFWADESMLGKLAEFRELLSESIRFDLIFCRVHSLLSYGREGGEDS